MARTVTVAGLVPLDPLAARALWSDSARWSSFVEGFARAVERDPQWPAQGAKLVWESGPGGRGRVTERVVEAAPEAFATEVFEERLTGIQRARFEAAGDGAGGTRVELSLEYDLTSQNPLGGLADVLFIRRALGDALRRTLRRFAVEAQEEAGLR